MPAKWTTSVLAGVPNPGRPAYVHAHTNGRVYAGNYATSTAQPSRVLEWDGASGALLRSWSVPGQRLGVEHGVQVANQTRDGHLVLLETSRRLVLTLDLVTGRFRRIATFPDGAVPNYATWGPGGLFVTDYAQPVIWRVDPSGRVRNWFSGPELQGAESFGTTGIVYRPRQRDLLITQQTTMSATPTQGHLYSLPVRDGEADLIETLWTSRGSDLPDGFGLARSGRIYIANAGLTNQLVVLDADGTERARFPATGGSGENGSPIPFDTPCSATFRGTEVLVANQSAVQQDATHMAILRVHVGERGVPPHLPPSARFAQ